MAAPYLVLRRGMTLVELLVVVAILGLLSVVVLPNLANSSDARKAREAARAVSGFIANGQSRAIGSRGGGGVWIEPLPTGITDALGMNHVVAIDLFAAQIPDPYAGETLTSNVIVKPTGRGGMFADLMFQYGFRLPATLTTSSNMAIRFAGSPATYRLAVSGTTGVATMDPTRNQTPFNTAWPVTPVNSPGVAYEIFLPAAKDPAASLTLGDGMAIDLTWTQLGSSALTWPPGAAISATAASQVLYDATGKPSQVIRSGGGSEPLIDPVCLLVAPIEMIQEGTCFTKSGAYWVAIDPRGGVPRVGEVQLLSTQQPPNEAALMQSQFYVRQSTFQEGR